MIELKPDFNTNVMKKQVFQNKHYIKSYTEKQL